jgi:hypothetical protein
MPFSATWRQDLDLDLDLERLMRARKPRRLPVVLTPEEVRGIHQRDLVDGWGRVALAHALARKDPPMQPGSGARSGCFHSPSDGRIQPPVNWAATTWNRA